MKQVWILNHYAGLPEAASTRHFHLATNLPASGWQAVIIAARTEHLSARKQFFSDEKSRLEIYDGIPFLWVRTPDYYGNGRGRILNMLAYSFRVLLPYCTRQLPKPDLIIGSSVHPFAALAGALLARRHQVPFVFEVRDLWPQTLIDMGRLREGSLVVGMMRKLERWLYRRATRIVVLPPHAVDYIAPLGIPAQNVVWIPNGVDLPTFPDPGPPQRKGNEPFVLMYFGAHGLANGLDHVLHAMKLVSQYIPPQAIKLRMVGDGLLKSELVRLSEQLGLSNVSFEPPVPKNTIPTLASEADAFVISVLNLPHLYRYGISMNKLFDYLAAARPVIIASSAANNPVSDSGAGITVAPEDPKGLSLAILALFRMSEKERHHMGCAGRRYVECNHGFDRLAARLAATMDDCVGTAL